MKQGRKEKGGGQYLVLVPNTLVRFSFFRSRKAATSKAAPYAPVMTRHTTINATPNGPVSWQHSVMFSSLFDLIRICNLKKNAPPQAKRLIQSFAKDVLAQRCLLLLRLQPNLLTLLFIIIKLTSSQPVNNQTNDPTPNNNKFVDIYYWKNEGVPPFKINKIAHHNARSARHPQHFTRA